MIPTEFKFIESSHPIWRSPMVVLEATNELGRSFVEIGLKAQDEPAIRVQAMRTIWKAFKVERARRALANGGIVQASKVMLIGCLLLALAVNAHARGLSPHDNAVHNFAHIGLGAVAGAGVLLILAPAVEDHPYLCALGIVAAGAGAQLAYKAATSGITDSRVAQVTGAGAVGAGIISLVVIRLSF